MTSLEKTMSIQAKRSLRFPEDRIAFRPGQTVAAADREVFQAYADRQITLKQAIFRMRNNNSLEEVTEEQFLNEFKICGYTRRDKYERVEEEMDGDYE